MIEAYVLIQVGPSATEAVTSQVAGVRGVVRADGVVGPYDVIARVKARDLDELADLVVTGIQSCDGVTRTLVCVVPGSEDGT